MGWLSEEEERPLAANADRYEGKPLLILLENYILDCIGCLSEEIALRIAVVVQKIYGGDDDWKATMRATLALEATLDESVRQLWQRNQEIARESGQCLTPDEFARMVVDENFSSALD